MLDSPSDDATGKPRPPTHSVSLVCLLLASGACIAFSVYALWQAGGLANTLAETGRPASPASIERAAAAIAAANAPRTAAAPTDAPAAPSNEPQPTSAAAGASEPPAAVAEEAPPEGAPAPVLSSLPPAADVTPATSFEASAEASEKVIPVGLEAAALDDAERTLTLGAAPPASYPRSRCNDIFVYIVTMAEGAPLHSAASLGIGANGPARLRHPGERLGDFRVLAITDDWSGLKPDVWLEKDGNVCRAQFAGNRSRVHAAPAPTPAPRPRATPPRRRGKR